MTSSIKWEPIEDLKAIRDVIDRTIVRPLASMPLPGLCSFHTLVDLYETPDAYLAQITVPGVEADDLDVSVSGRKMVIRGERKAGEESSKVLHRERPWGKLSRALRIPKDVDTGQISAKLISGILTVTMPKQKAAEEEAAPE
jgi:HSP20 family protein